MELTAKEDIEAPVARVFEALSDFETIERKALRNGIDVRRTDDLAGTRAGMAWRARFRFRGAERSATVTLAACDPPERMQFDTVTGGLEMRTGIDLVALSPSRTRVLVSVTMQPRTLSARLIVQSMKLAGARINKRFRQRVADHAKELEARLSAGG